jgi:hypothetical protein
MKVLQVINVGSERAGQNGAYVTLWVRENVGQQVWPIQAFEGSFGGLAFAPDESGDLSLLPAFVRQVVLAECRQFGDFWRLDGIVPRSYFVGDDRVVAMCSDSERRQMDELRIDSAFLRAIRDHHGAWVELQRLARDIERALGGETLSPEDVRASARRVWEALRPVGKETIEHKDDGDRFRIVRLSSKAEDRAPMDSLFD